MLEVLQREVVGVAGAASLVCWLEQAVAYEVPALLLGAPCEDAALAPGERTDCCPVPCSGILMLGPS
jgi:hypothetical protein